MSYSFQSITSLPTRTLALFDRKAGPVVPSSKVLSCVNGLGDPRPWFAEPPRTASPNTLGNPARRTSATGQFIRIF